MNGAGLGHLEMIKTLEKIKLRFYWVECHQAVADWIASCTQCITAKDPARSRGQLLQYNWSASFNLIAVDVAGPFPIRNRYVLVVMHYFRKWPEVW